jgi:hypothetical protein
MASNFYLSNYSASAQASSLVASGYLNGASLKIYNGSQPANGNTAITTQSLLATVILPNPAGTVSNGVITFSAISNATASGTGTATWFRIVNGANTICDGSVGTSGCDLNLTTTSLVASSTPVNVSSFLYTVTQ